MAHVSSTVSDLYTLAEGVPCTRVRIDPPAFQDGDDVIFMKGNMTHLTGKVYAPKLVRDEYRPGTTAVYVHAWGVISYGIPEEHLHRLT